MSQKDNKYDHKLAVIIVNYNVKHFLEQALISVEKSSKKINIEVWVVDNNSVDGSVEMLRNKFAWVKVIVNKINVGFSKANNQAILKAKSEYILLLNPDTILEEDTLEKCIEFMDNHPEAGGLGVKMFDGKGRFLPESKRGLPTPEVAFYKIFGLAKLFPNSRKFGKYHLTYLDNDKTHQIEVLSGAFMFMRKKVLDKVGLLDEDYFMYGEDIDLSYRITKGGYKNYYFAGTRIIHYKGESTKKASVSYVFTFYRAMVIFAKKHFSKKNAGAVAFLINFAIYLRAGVEIFKQFVTKAFLPAIDCILVYTGLILIKLYWEVNVKNSEHYYPETYTLFVLPSYALVLLLSIYLNGGYDKPFSVFRIIRGAFIGTILISSISNFIDSYRFSKAILILGGAWAALSFIITKLIIHYSKFKNMDLGQDKNNRVILVGNEDETKRVQKIFFSAKPAWDVIGFVSVTKPSNNENHLGSVKQLAEIINIYKINEVIFCSKDIPSHQIIEWMTVINAPNIEYKIVPDETNYVIGSNSKETQGSIYTVEVKLNITGSSSIRNKRLLDVIVSSAFILTSPILLFLVKQKKEFLLNLIKVWTGQITFVGFSDHEHFKLSGVKKGIINPASIFKSKQLDKTALRRLDYLYAKDYTPYLDISLIIKNIKKLGRKPK